MKALEILEEDKKRLEGIARHYRLSPVGVQKLKSINEAIAELEALQALQAPKTCVNCYHSLIFDDSWRRCPCIFLVDEDGEPTSLVPNEFYCDLYHPKASK